MKALFQYIHGMKIDRIGGHKNVTDNFKRFHNGKIQKTIQTHELNMGKYVMSRTFKIYIFFGNVYLQYGRITPGCPI